VLVAHIVYEEEVIAAVEGDNCASEIEAEVAAVAMLSNC
jgi:hypothetical protein